MGKANRAREKRLLEEKNRADKASFDSYGSSAHSEKKPKKWLTPLITVLVVAIIVGSLGLNFYYSSGSSLRKQVAMETDHFQVTGTMLNYYFKSQYLSFYQTYQTYVDYGLLFNAQASLKGQTVGSGYLDSQIVSDFNGTWYDYFMGMAITYANQVLVLCEAAYEAGVKLDDEELAAIESELEEVEKAASMYGYTTDAYIAATYGTGMRLKDLREALKLTRLSDKYSEIYGEGVYDLIDANDGALIREHFAKQRTQFLTTDYDLYQFSITYRGILDELSEDLPDDYTDEQYKAMEEQAKAEYTKRIAAMKENAAELAACKTEDAFRAKIAEILLDDQLDSLYASSMKEFLDKAPADIASWKSATRTAILNALKTGDAFEATQAGSEDEFAQEYADFESALFTRVERSYKAAQITGGTYNENDVAKSEDGTALNVWLFDENLKANDTEVFLLGDSDGKLSTRSASATVVRIAKPAEPDETTTRNLVYVLYTNDSDASAASASANAALAALKDALNAGKEITNDLLKEIMPTDNLTGSGIIENYIKGTFGDDSFDEYVYGDDTEIGDSTVLKLDDHNFAVLCYLSDGQPVWYVNTRTALFTEKVSEWAEDVAEKYAVKTPDLEKVYDKINA